MVRGITSSHSAGANCEATFTTSLLQLKDLVRESKVVQDSNEIVQEDPRISRAIAALDEAGTLCKPIHKAAVGYVAGYVAKVVLKKFNCTYCKMHILGGDKSSSYHELVVGKEFNSKYFSLSYCNVYFINCIYRCYNITKCILSNFSLERKVCETILLYVRHYVKFSFICDHKQEICNFIMKFVVQFCIFNFCKGLNRIMCGKDSRLPSDRACVLYRQAYTISIRNKKRCSRT